MILQMPLRKSDWISTRNNNNSCDILKEIKSHFRRWWDNNWMQYRHFYKQINTFGRLPILPPSMHTREIVSVTRLRLWDTRLTSEHFSIYPVYQMCSGNKYLTHPHLLDECTYLAAAKLEIFYKEKQISHFLANIMWTNLIIN